MQNDTTDLLRQILDELKAGLKRATPPAPITVDSLLARPPSAIVQLDPSRVRDGAGGVFDALVTRKGPPGGFLKGFALPQLRTILQNLSVELLKGLGSVAPQVRSGPLARILQGTIFNAPIEQAARQQSAAAVAQTGAATQLTGAAEALNAAAGALQQAAGGPAGSPFVSPLFGGRLGGILAGSGLNLLARATSGFGRTGTVLGAAAAGALFGAKGAGFGIAGLGKVGGALLGGALTGGLAAGLLFGLPRLFRRGPTPAERDAEIERTLEANRFTLPDPLEREMGFSQGASGEVDYGYGDVPRLAPRLVVNVSVSAMDSRSFLDRAPEIASAVRRAMLDMHPINQMVREAF